MNNDEYNPGQNDINKKTDFLKRAENNKDIAKNSSNQDLDDIQENEKNPDSQWKNNVLNDPSSSSKSQSKFTGFAKKKGPLTAIILTLVGGGLGIGGLLSPSLLIVNLKEMMVKKFNSQLTSLDIRTNKVLRAKTFNSGSCGTIIKCKYSSMPDYQVKRFAKAGLTVNFDENAGTNLLGRKKIESITYNNDKLSPNDFKNRLNTDPSFRLAVRKAYNPLFAGFSDKIWNKTLFKFKMSEKGVKLTGATEEEKLKNIQKEIKNPSPLNNIDAPDVKKIDPKTGKNYTLADVEAYESLNVSRSGIAAEASEVASTGVKATTKLAAKTAANAVKITGIADDACTVYTTIRAVGFAAKTVRAAQLARYAMMFLVVADQIKAGGNPSPEDVSYLGKVLTTESIQKDFEGNTINDKEGKPVVKSATDSFGYKYAAYGEVGKMPASATQFLAGAGLTGSLIGVTTYINTILGGTPKDTCRVLNNIFVQIGSAIAGVALAIVSGGVTFTVAMAAKVGAGLAVAVALSYLPALLQDIIAGVVIDKGTVGELAGDAITSGSGVMMSDVAAKGGNAPLTKTQAIAYNELTNDVAARYAEEDRIAYGPMDISSSNTFLGSIVSKLTPHLSNMTSIPNSINSVSSIISNSFTGLSPIAKAVDANQYSLCEDTDYAELSLAADPFCNLVYGIPNNTLQNIEPEAVVDVMIDNNQIDTTTGEAISGSTYETYLTNCINRVNPIGWTGESYEEDNGDYCVIDESLQIGDSNYLNKYFYLYSIDKRVIDGMDGEDKVLAAAQDKNLDANISFYDGSNNKSNNTAIDNFIKETQSKTSSIIKFLIQPINIINNMVKL